ncbi:MAG TPA: hypothetical protein VGA00_08990 [Acidiferrobacterales bacterium]
MRQLVAALTFLACAPPVAADAPWRFAAPVVVAAPARDAVFHHLDSAGRRALAAGRDAVAVVYESNASGRPEVCAALRGHRAERFGAPRRISGGGDAFEPVIVALDAGGFVAAWEEGGAVWARRVAPDSPGPATRLAADAAQISLAAAGADIAAVWAERHDGRARIVHSRLRVDRRGAMTVGSPRAVDTDPPAADQAYPAVALGRGGTVVAWEDRRHGHTVLYYSHAAPGKRFRPPQRLNELPAERAAIYGKGSGVARVVLTALDGRRVAAAWLDKRDFTSGYTPYAAFSDDGGRRFGANRAMPDAFAAGVSQWHVAVAGNRRGRVAFVWHDERDGHGDLWLSWPAAQEFSEDLAVPDAAGPERHRSQPVLAMDADGDLHLAWEERDAEGGSNRIVYAHGRRADTPWQIGGLAARPARY